MKALVLAGGSGTRLRPFSYSMPKQLIPVANKPVLVHGLEALREAGVQEIGIIVGNHREEIEATVADRIGVPITYIQQDRPRGLAHCVMIARDFLGEDDFVMYLGDNILSPGITEMAEEFRRRRPVAQIAVTPVPDPREYGVAEVDAEGWVTGLAEKPVQPRSDLALIGVYFFTAKIHEAVASTPLSWRNEYEITDAIAQLVQGGRQVSAYTYTGYWKDTGRIPDLLACNRALLEAIEPACAGEVDRDSEILGAVLIEAGARIVNSRIVGPTVIGAGTLVQDSVVGPYSAIGQDCVLRSAGVENSILLQGASVSQVHDIRESVIGRNAAVSSASGPANHCLVVGDHTQVEIVA